MTVISTQLRNSSNKTRNLVIWASNLSVTTQREGLVPLPGSTARRPCLVVKVTSTTETSVLLSCRGKTTKLSVLVDGIANPVNSWVVPDGVVCCINENNFEILVS